MRVQKSVSINVSPKIFKIVFPAIFIFMGVVFLCVTLIVRFSFNSKKERCTEKVTATVIRLERIERTDSDHNRSVTYAPVFCYNANGKDITVQSSTSSNPCDYYEGQEVELFYNPNKLNEYYIENDGVSRILILVFGIIGGFFLIVGIILAFVLKKYFSKESAENNFVEQERQMETQYDSQSYYK